ncbi:hypothetical protein RA27_17995 [Ruegeria sp. ANG-R]|uniref:DUF58 domain-containing protein n=1 Tax=Ruegeria sp. ANG-R TaxID=1577903 RepID=UPI00057ED4BF|nr:DUF58 domain-containing protein [Ruegeria sp. ANG-R]KIC39047.1 hypothetical protein RA27_17995 [Ruegeria sp. ANG-R]
MQGISISLPELVRARPPRGLTGFAPSGRVSTHQWGANRSIFRGRGMEFAESRAYQPGDDVKSIDWRVTARTGHAHTKLFQEERERPVHILLDLRAMMQFGTRVRFKSNLAAEIAAMLAWVGHDGGDRVGGLVLTRDGVMDFRAERTRRAVLRFLEKIAEQTDPEIAPQAEVTLAKGIRRLRRVCRPGTLAFVISDFNDFDDSAAKELRRLSNTAHVTNIQISDPLDVALPPNGGRISDGHTATSLSSIGKGDLQAYADHYAARQARLSQVSRQNAMALHHLQTSDDPAQILYQTPQNRSAA